MKFTSFAFALTLLTLPAAAQDKKATAPQSSTSVLINGQPIKGKVLEVDGKHFVAVEDLAQSLRGTISYGDGQIALTLPQLPSTFTQAPPSPAPPSSPPVFSQPGPTQAAPPQAAPPSQPSSIAAAPAEAGSVKGTLTYFFDFHTGSK